MSAPLCQIRAGDLVGTSTQEPAFARKSRTDSQKSLPWPLHHRPPCQPQAVGGRRRMRKAGVCPTMTSETGTSAAATAALPGPVWGAVEGTVQKHGLGSHPSLSRARLPVGTAGSRVLGGRGRAGHLKGFPIRPPPASSASGTFLQPPAPSSVLCVPHF